MSPLVRPATDGDAPGLIALVGACFAEYPGCVLDVDGEIPELRAIASAFADDGGEFWVAEREGLLVGSIGWVPAGQGAELRKLYVAASGRRRGLGSRLCALVEDAARTRGLPHVELWSDTRFHEAHALYERRGYARGAKTRTLGDRSSTEEFFFRLPLDGRV